MRILVGGCVRQAPEVLRAHLQTLQWQRLPQGVSLSFYFVDDNLDNESSELLASVEGACVLPATERPDGAEYSTHEGGHSWTIPTFYHLAVQKQRLLEIALLQNFDAVLLVDSDLLLAPDTLTSLLATEKEVVSGVFWTSWGATDAPLPQVWTTHPYGFDGAGWTTHTFLRDLRNRSLVRVRGLGACTLIRTNALRRGAAFWPLVPGLPEWGMWQGEDRHFCVRAERQHIELWADAWPQIYHVYRPSDRTHCNDVIAQLAIEPAIIDGTYVSLIVEPCEEPQLALHKEHIRGRIGSLPLLPDIEDAVREMRVGDSRFVRAHFPAECEIEEYRGRAKGMRITLGSASLD